MHAIWGTKRCAGRLILYREVGVIISAFSGTGADVEDERKGGQLASYPGVPAVPEAMPLKGATKWGAKPRQRFA